MFSEDDSDYPPQRPTQRVRHISTSSTTSVTKFVPQQVGRIRTESTCSAYSDVSIFKPRRTGRSDEYNRANEIRKELIKKCENGEEPDKSQLRMYDMIYYNPKTNPMKRHSEESEGQSEDEKDGKKRERRQSMSSNRSAVKEVDVFVKPAEPKKEKEPVS